jgi:hypothetical protein
VATDPKPEGCEWCDALGLWKRTETTARSGNGPAMSASDDRDADTDAAATEDDEAYEPSEDDDKSSNSEESAGGTNDAKVGVCLHSIAHAILEEKASHHKVRMAYAKLGTMMGLAESCPNVESDPSAKGKAASGAAPAFKCDDESAGEASEGDEGKVLMQMDARPSVKSDPSAKGKAAREVAASAVKCDESGREASEDDEGKVVVRMDHPASACPFVPSDPSVKSGSATGAVKSSDCVAPEDEDDDDDDDDDDEVRVVSVKKGSSPAVIGAPIRSAAPVDSGGPVTSTEATQRIYRVKQALEWEIAFDHNVVDAATLQRLHELLESLQPIRMTVQLLHETNINVSLLTLKSELAKRKSPATKPLLKRTKHLLGKWKDMYELHKHMNKELRPAVQSWREAIESGHAQRIGAELRRLLQLVSARGLSRHFVRELGLEKLLDESRKVYARRNEKPSDAFEELRRRMRTAPDELQV